MSKKVVIIGGGAAGEVCAVRASQFGNEVILIEKDKLGGTCLNRGCIPTKTFIHSANTYYDANNCEFFGVKASDVKLDFPTVVKHKDKVIRRLRKGVGFMVNKHGISLINGTATIVDPKTVKVVDSNEQIKADVIVIATGSFPADIKIDGKRCDGVMNSNEALELQELPESIAIIGGGVIGLEFAQYMQRMGVKVTVIEILPQIMSTEDQDIIEILETQLKKDGIQIFTGAKVNQILPSGKGQKVSFSVAEGNNEIVADKVLFAGGRKPETTGLGLENLGIKLEKNFIVVNDKMETNIPGIYAVGDVVGGIMLAHLAGAEGKCAAENINGMERKMSYSAVPRCIYTTPEIACVGLTEKQAKEKYNDGIGIGIMPLMANSKSIIQNASEGMMKVIAEKKQGRIVGVEIIAPHATEMISEAVLAITMGATGHDIAAAIHPHPTIGEAIWDAALNIDGMAINI
jgi:dihydrolipoamide dehydrogenase